VKLVDYTGRDAALEADPNPFAAVALAHLKAQETKGDRAARYAWKVRLVKGLYDRGLDRVRMERLFRLIDWVIKLPQVERLLFRREMNAFEKERTVERLSPTLQDCWDEGLATGLQRAIERGLNRRFGQAGLDLVPRVRLVTASAALEDLIDAVETVPNLDAFRAMLPPPPQA
jgi:hypothetical protein